MDGEVRVADAGRDDGESEAIQKRIIQLGIQEQVLLMGERLDIPDLLQISDIAVSASHEEGLSNSILEAMTMGLPVVATKVGGSIETLSDEITGLLVEPRQPLMLARALCKLVDEPGLRFALGRAAKIEVNTEYCINSTVTKYEEVYSGFY